MKYSRFPSKFSMKEIVRRVNMPDSGAMKQMKQMSANSSLSMLTGGLFHAPLDLTMKKKEMTHAQGTIFKGHQGLFLGDFSVFFSRYSISFFRTGVRKSANHDQEIVMILSLFI